MKRVQLSHGGGGQEMNQLITSLFFRHLGNDILLRNEDAAVLNCQGEIAMTTDCFTVSPLFFAGGNIGKLAVAGTVNDLAMMGAEPQYLSCGFIIEEGLLLDELEAIVISMAEELKVSGAKIVCGDTKVVPKGCADGLFINTTGIGHIRQSGISVHNVQPGDAILVSRDIGCHGACVLSARESLKLVNPIESDCATLWPVINTCFEQKIPIHSLRDATRGGISAVLNEWCEASHVQLVLEDKAIAVSDDVMGVCELFGFEPYDLANEGTFIMAVSADAAEDALSILTQFSEHAAIVGYATQGSPHKTILNSPWGSRRYLDFPNGELLPRIC
ncbi:hydrogenase expression/formation protein HypE [Photobacterium indicum]|uniref:hydrogenase expression/formation protein HypE n=1 Tax=Photobacterium indicum TaxID=81447 RepID=UPI003D0D10E4